MRGQNAATMRRPNLYVYDVVPYRSACLEENTTWDLVKDIERLREHLKVEKWHVFGGSWVRSFLLSFHSNIWTHARPSYVGLDIGTGLCAGIYSTITSPFVFTSVFLKVSSRPRQVFGHTVCATPTGLPSSPAPLFTDPTDSPSGIFTCRKM